MLIGSMMCMDMVSSPYRHTQSRGVRLWCGSEYCSRLAIFLDVEMLKHFFFLWADSWHARYGVGAPATRSQRGSRRESI